MTTADRKWRIRDVAPAVRALGMTCNYRPDYMEWRIDYRRSDSRWTPDTAYYTTHPDDAVESARLMMQAERATS